MMDICRDFILRAFSNMFRTFQFLEKMQLDYHTAAKENNCYVVGACGFDSIPSDMGTVFLEQQFAGQVNTVEAYLNIKAEHVSFTTKSKF